MKLADHTEHIRQLIDSAFRHRLGHEDITPGHRGITAGTLPPAETCEKWVEQSTFTLFNRLAAIKVMEAHALPTEIDEVFPFSPPSPHSQDSSLDATKPAITDFDAIELDATDL